MIAKNEGETIRQALESATPFVDEYVIGIDSLSEDNTIEEVLEFAHEHKIPTNVYTFDWENDFSRARNDCIKRSKYDWIFTLDGHETIENAEKIRKVKQNFDDYEIGIFNVVMHAKGNVTSFPQERLFHRKYPYSNKSHNVLVYDECKAAFIKDVIINHDRSIDKSNDRVKQRKDMNFADLDERIKNGDRRAKAQIIQEYMVQKDWESAIVAIKDYLNEEMEDNERYQVLIKMSMCYFYNREMVESEYCLRQCERFNKDNRNAHLVFLGELYYKYGYYEKAKEVLEQSLMIPKPEIYWFLYPHFYHRIPLELLKKVESKIDEHIIKGNGSEKN